MKKVYKKVLTISEIEALEKVQVNRSFKIHDQSPEFIFTIINNLKADFEFSLHKQSYWRVEQSSQGHPWHLDTGSNNHMMWCKIGCTMLLDGDFEGGETFYKKDNKQQLIPREKYELLAHTSDEEHMVNPSVGKRKVLLLFI